MIAASLLYLVAISFLLAIAALAGEQIADLLGLPKRFVWAGAMGLMIVLSGARLFAARSSLPAPARDAVRFTAQSLPPSTRRAARNATDKVLVAASSAEKAAPSRLKVVIARARLANNRMVSRLRPYETLFALGWLVLSALAAAFLAGSLLRVRRGQRDWVPHVLDRTPVMLTDDLGPAIVGLWSYEIVLPVWVLDLPTDQQHLIVAHEREHSRAHDPRVLFGAFALAALLPWNLPLWFMALRLRDAIELDCDARVLETDRTEPETYGSLLLDVSERAVEANMPIAALAEPAKLLGRRINALTALTPRFTLGRAATLAVVMMFVGALACIVPGPQPPRTSNAAARIADAGTDSIPRFPTVGVVGRPPRPIEVMPEPGTRTRMQFGRWPMPEHQEMLRLARELHPDAFVSHGDSASLVAIMVDSAGKLVWHDAIVTQRPVRNLLAGRLGNGFIELGPMSDGATRAFGDIFPGAPKGAFTVGGLVTLSHEGEPPIPGMLVWVVRGPPR